MGPRAPRASSAGSLAQLSKGISVTGRIAASLAAVTLSAMQTGVGVAAGHPQLLAHQETMMDDRANLARLVEPLDAEAARLIRDAHTKIKRMTTPFLRDGLIFLVIYEGQ